VIRIVELVFYVDKKVNVLSRMDRVETANSLSYFLLNATTAHHDGCLLK
jgi:hypothetical protein